MKSLTVNASEDKLSEVLEFIDAQLEMGGASPKTQFQIDLAVEELYVNIVHYAYAPDIGNVIIQFDIAGEPPLAEIQFIDQGKPYNPLENPDPDITLTAEDREIGGLGVLMVKKTMDVAAYRYENKKNIMTIEDPVEYSIEGVSQVSVCSKTGISFSSGLRSVLRQDPDVIMIGEIRDEETARTAVRAAITGHLVLSTLHTNDSTSAIIRLVDMGVPSYLASDAMVGIIAQRLVRKICVFCREEILSDQEASAVIYYDSIEKIYKGKGCPKCNYTGYHGRTVVYECNKIDAEKKMIIQNTKTVEEMRRQNFEAGMKTLKENCMNLVRNGVTTLEEYKRITINQ